MKINFSKFTNAGILIVMLCIGFAFAASAQSSVNASQAAVNDTNKVGAIKLEILPSGKSSRVENNAVPSMAGAEEHVPSLFDNNYTPQKTDVRIKEEVPPHKK